MNGLSAADFADTGQWRLIIKIFSNGMSAYLENTIHTDLEPQLLFSSNWESDPDALLRNIESSVYDHPRVLDDFSARIIIYDRKTVFMPTQLAEEIEGGEEIYYTALYSVNPEDVISEAEGDVTAAYSPAPGLNGFLNRTFPGARITCNLMNSYRRVKKTGTGNRIYIETRPGEADFILMNGDSLLSASTHSWNAESDILYHAFNIMDVYGISPRETTCILDNENMSGETKGMLEKFCAKIEVMK